MVTSTAVEETALYGIPTPLVKVHPVTKSGEGELRNMKRQNVKAAIKAVHLNASVKVTLLQTPLKTLKATWSIDSTERVRQFRPRNCIIFIGVPEEIQHSYMNVIRQRT